MIVETCKATYECVCAYEYMNVGMCECIGKRVSV